MVSTSLPFEGIHNIPVSNIQWLSQHISLFGTLHQNILSLDEVVEYQRHPTMQETMGSFLRMHPKSVIDAS